MVAVVFDFQELFTGFALRLVLAVAFLGLAVLDFAGFGRDGERFLPPRPPGELLEAMVA